jgi:hypothetical protein
MFKTKKVFKPKKPSSKEKLLKQVEVDKNEVERNETSEWMALLETKYKPPPKINKHENLFK